MTAHDGFDTGQKLIEAFCDIETLIAENGRLRAAIVKHREEVLAAVPAWEMGADLDAVHQPLWALVLEGGDTDGL
jgi:hypothetical protein